MTFERSLSTWEPMELRHLGDVAGVIQGGSGGGPAHGKSIPSPGDPGEPNLKPCLLYTSPSPRDRQKSRMPSSA